MQKEKALRVLPAAAIAASLGACDPGPTIPAKSNFSRALECAQSADRDYSYGNGFYYFPCVDEAPAAMKTFEDSHPDLEIASIAVRDTGPYGKTSGYLIKTRPKQCR